MPAAQRGRTTRLTAHDDGDGGDVCSPRRHILRGHVPRNAALQQQQLDLAAAFALRGAGTSSSSSSPSRSNASAEEEDGAPSSRQRRYSGTASVDSDSSSLPAAFSSPRQPSARLVLLRGYVPANARYSETPRRVARRDAASSPGSDRGRSLGGSSSSSSSLSPRRSTSESSSGTSASSTVTDDGYRHSSMNAASPAAAFRLPRASESGSPRASFGDDIPTHTPRTVSTTAVEDAASTPPSADAARLAALRRLIPTTDRASSPRCAADAQSADPQSGNRGSRRRSRSPSESDSSSDSANPAVPLLVRVSAGSHRTAAAEEEPALSSARKEGVSPLAFVAASGSTRGSPGQNMLPRRSASGLATTPQRHSVGVAARRSSQGHRVTFAADDTSATRESTNRRAGSTPIGTAVIITDDVASSEDNDEADDANRRLSGGDGTGTAASSALSAFEAAYRLSQEEQRMTYAARQQQQLGRSTHSSSFGAGDDIIVSARSTMASARTTFASSASSRPSSAGTALGDADAADLAAWLQIEADALDRAVDDEVAAHAAWAQEVEASIAALDREAAGLGEALQASRRDGQMALQHIGRARTMFQKAPEPAAAASEGATPMRH